MQMLYRIIFYLFFIAITLAATTTITTNNFNNNVFAQMMQQQQANNNQTSLVLQDPSSLQGSFFTLDNMTFSHQMASVNGVQLHYVIGGHGDPLVLLHGWPQTWYA